MTHKIKVKIRDVGIIQTPGAFRYITRSLTNSKIFI